jgi:outer membrane protein OmpA-like peptidoglycan-associated protein
MKRLISLLVCCLFPVASVLAASDPNDIPGSSDPELFSRMPGFHIQNFETLAFDRQEFKVGPSRNENIEGRKVRLHYYANEGVTLPSGLQVTRNYVNAAKAIGGAEIYGYEDGGTEYSVIRVTSKDKEFWVEVAGASNGMYTLCMIERQLMKQEVVANAEAMSNSIRNTGRVALYGIYFDTDKADLKPASDPAVAEIVKMLKADPSLKLFVVGHTDTVGQFAHNVQLSQARAAAVVNALVSKHGIAAARLTSFGCGPTVPVAANGSEDGRAKNRRVELVAQ